MTHYVEEFLPSRAAIWRHRILRYGPLLLWMGLISWASTEQFSSDNTVQVFRPWLLWLFPRMSPDDVEWAHTVIRKSAHVTEYAIFALLAARALIGSSRWFLSRHWYLACCGLLLAMAASDEFHQSFIPRRTASVYDVMIDVCGGVAALTILAAWRHWRRVRAARKHDRLANQVDGTY